MGLIEYNPDEWRLFKDSFKRSLECVLLHNSSKFACVPIEHSVIAKEHYLNVKMVLQKLRYSEHNWAICVDFKMVNFLLGQQEGYTKHPCFLCYWNSCSWLPDPFRGMGAWQKTMEPQKPGNSPGSGPEVVERQRITKE